MKVKDADFVKVLYILIAMLLRFNAFVSGFSVNYMKPSHYLCLLLEFQSMLLAKEKILVNVW